jgi:hypothetical protein
MGCPSMRSFQRYSCGAVRRSGSARRCVYCTRPRQTPVLQPHASGIAVRPVERRPALALTLQVDFATAPRRAGAVLRAQSWRTGTRDATGSGLRRKPAASGVVGGARWRPGPGSETNLSALAPG